MRGKPFHNSMVTDLREMASKFFSFIGREYRVSRNGVTDDLDLFARRDPVSLAFEVETTSRHAVDNAIKAALVEVPLWIIVPRRSLKIDVAHKLEPLGLRPGGEPVKILLLGQVEQELTNYLSLFIPANKQKGKE
jgi:hypothetical protein